MSTHAIKGTTTLVIAGETRTLACDMNCAAALHEAKGEHWNEWLVERFLGEAVRDESGAYLGQRVKPLKPTEVTETLYALLATDREDRGRVETPKSLRRAIGLAELPDLQLAMVRVVLAGFGVPGEFIGAVASAADGPRARAAAAGTGTKP